MFAGINRGLCSADDDLHKMPYKFRRRLLRSIIELMPGPFLAKDLLAGSDFVTNLRLLWIRTLANLENPPTIVQIVGTDDKLVSRYDSLDVDQFPSGHRIDLAGANHSTVLVVETEAGLDAGRYALIKKGAFGALERTANQTAQKDTVVFVVHGIRDSTTTWVDGAVKLLRSRLPNAVIVPATYGYFSALQFILSPARKRRTRWFKETYSYYLSRYPTATFHFLGHSNGTYLLGYSLKALPDIRFAKVVLAGSVLPEDFDWTSRIGTQVLEVWNHRSRWDVPVGILCSALRAVKMSDVGTGGYRGFRDPDIHECSYHPGGHGATVDSEYLPLLVSEITEQHSTLCEPRASESVWFSRLSRASMILPYFALSVVVLSVYFGGPSAAHVMGIGIAWCRALIAILLLSLIGWLLDIL